MKNLFKNFLLTSGLLVISLTSSCSLFIDDATPAIVASSAIEDIGIASLDTIAKLVNQSTGLDALTKAELLRRVADEKVKLTELSQALRALLATYGTVDWKTVSEDVYELYKKYRSNE